MFALNKNNKIIKLLIFHNNNPEKSDWKVLTIKKDHQWTFPNHVQDIKIARNEVEGILTRLSFAIPTNDPIIFKHERMVDKPDFILIGLNSNYMEWPDKKDVTKWLPVEQFATEFNLNDYSFIDSCFQVIEAAPMRVWRYGITAFTLEYLPQQDINQCPHIANTCCNCRGKCVVIYDPERNIDIKKGKAKYENLIKTFQGKNRIERFVITPHRCYVLRIIGGKLIEEETSNRGLFDGDIYSDSDDE